MSWSTRVSPSVTFVIIDPITWFRRGSVMQFEAEDMKFQGRRVDLEYCKSKNGEREYCNNIESAATLFRALT